MRAGTAETLATFGRVCCLAGAALVLAGCETAADRVERPGGGESAVVKGSVDYDPITPLPAGAALEVALFDLSSSESGAEVVETVRLAPAARGPMTFEIGYDPRVIEPDHLYAVMGRIRTEERVLFLSGPPQPVLTHGRPAASELALLDSRSPEGRRRLFMETRDMLAGALDEGRAAYPVIDDTAADERHRMQIRAWLIGDDVARIEEQAADAEYGEARSSYWYRDGVLLRYQSRLDERGVDATRAIQQITLYFTDEGEPAGGDYFVGGEPEPLTGQRVEYVVQHAARLRERAIALGKGVPSGGPHLRCGGSAPDWSIELFGGRATLSRAGAGEQDFSGQYRYRWPYQSFAGEWRGFDAAGDRSIAMEIYDGRCGEDDRDSVSTSLRIDEEAELAGCCGLAEPLPAP
jgi:uncharacterized lipoprotein YbaY